MVITLHRLPKGTIDTLIEVNQEKLGLLITGSYIITITKLHRTKYISSLGAMVK
jgi:hypothetical protein